MKGVPDSTLDGMGSAFSQLCGSETSQVWEVVLGEPDPLGFSRDFKSHFAWLKAVGKE